MFVLPYKWRYFAIVYIYFKYISVIAYNIALQK